MKTEHRNAAKEAYKALRRVPWHALWEREVQDFNASPADARVKRAGIIRAVGVVFSESGPQEEKETVLQWLRGLLHDPSEKIRRYAMAAIPKIGATAEDENRLLAQFKDSTEEREKRHLHKALAKIGGAAALEQSALGPAEQKIKAKMTRQTDPSTLRFGAVLEQFAGLRVHLRGRRGLERFVAEEAREHRKFRVLEVRPGCVVLTPAAAFSMADIYAMRCFGSIGFSLGIAVGKNEAETLPGLAALMTSPFALRLWRAFTEGAIRYRIDFAGKGHQRAAVAKLAELVYARCAQILNDPQKVTWTADIYTVRQGQQLELRPNITPDPRFAFRQKDVPAASHPPLAASLARLAGRAEKDVVWDPFCGSGLELIERALLGGVERIIGSDLSSEAVEIARNNFAAAKTAVLHYEFIHSDFRDAALAARLKAAGVTLIVTNPPMGMRVPVADLHRLIDDIFRVAARVLKPGGRLVLVNPSNKAIPPSSFKLEVRQPVDMGGFECGIEKYTRLAAR